MCQHTCSTACATTLSAVTAHVDDVFPGTIALVTPVFAVFPHILTLVPCVWNKQRKKDLAAQSVLCQYSVCTSFLHKVSFVNILCAHNFYTRCPLSIFCVHIISTQSVLCQYSVCTSFLHKVSFVNILCAHHFYTKCPLSIFCVHIILFNPFSAMLAATSLGKRPIKVPNLKPLRLPLLRMRTWKDFYQNAQI